jgi:flagellar hook assembly protein FlgD
MYVRVETAGQVKISVYNIAGQKVAELLNGIEPAGQYSFAWNGRNTRGDFVGNGVYFMILQQPSGKKIRKVIVLK